MVVESSYPPEILRYQNAVGHRRQAVMGDDGEDPGDRTKCTGNAFKACTAGVIADCVAVCCCPCAVVDCLVLALFKVPWTVGRKCLRRRKKQKRGGGGRRQPDNKADGVVVDRDGISRSEWVEEGLMLEKDNFSARFDAEKVWFELYQFGHLGFGRVPFTGIPPQGDGY